MSWYQETWVDKAIREARERGEFDDLPGAGKPLTNLGDPNDPDWWVKGLMEREQLDMTGAMPGVLALRKEAAGFPESLSDLRSEGNVREVLEDYNRRVKLDRLRPAAGALPPVVARTVDVDELVAAWRTLRDEARARAEAARLAEEHAAEQGAPARRPTRRRRWFRRSQGPSRQH